MPNLEEINNYMSDHSYSYPSALEVAAIDLKNSFDTIDYDSDLELNDGKSVSIIDFINHVNDVLYRDPIKYTPLSKAENAMWLYQQDETLTRVSEDVLSYDKFIDDPNTVNQSVHCLAMEEYVNDLCDSFGIEKIDQSILNNFKHYTNKDIDYSYDEDLEI